MHACPGERQNYRRSLRKVQYKCNPARIRHVIFIEGLHDGLIESVRKARTLPIDSAC